MSEPVLIPGTRYSKNGRSIDILDVKDGEVYLRRWPKGVETQPFFNNCLRVPLAHFINEVKTATLEIEGQPK